MTPRGSDRNENFCVDLPQVPTISFSWKVAAQLRARKGQDPGWGETCTKSWGGRAG